MSTPLPSGQRLATLAAAAGLSAPAGSEELVVHGACALAPGRRGCITYAEDASAGDALAATAAAAIVTTPALAERAAIPTLTTTDPRLAFARLARLFERDPPSAGVHSSAVIAADARVDPAASIGAHAVIGAGCRIAAGAIIAANSVLGANAEIGPDTRIAANVSIGADVRVGARVVVEANAVIGARGFGLVHDGAAWAAVPQLAGVRIDDDVEIGAGTSIDRGALEDTVIGAGVKIDNQVHIAHNCVIGAHTVIAGCTGIAGSVTVGSRCMIGGGVGIGDHVHLADGVILTAASQVPASIAQGGVYSSTFRAMPARIWRKRLALFRQLDRLEARLKRLERGTANSGKARGE